MLVVRTVERDSQRREASGEIGIYSYCRGFNLGFFFSFDLGNNPMLKIIISMFKHVLAKSDAAKNLLLISFWGLVIIFKSSF